MSSSRCKQYKEVKVAPGSDMFEMMEAIERERRPGEKAHLVKVAEAHYQACMAKFNAANPNYRTYP